VTIRNVFPKARGIPFTLVFQFCRKREIFRKGIPEIFLHRASKRIPGKKSRQSFPGKVFGRMAGSTGNFRTIYGGNVQYPGGLGQPFKEVFSLISIHPSALEDKLKMGTIYAPGIAGKRFIFGGKKRER
jgi:hypothetical protein